MPIEYDPYRIPSDDDAIFGGKYGGPGGGRINFNPPGQGVGGSRGGGGGSGGMIGFDYDRTQGFDPMGEQRRRKMAAAFRNPMRLGDQQPMMPGRIDPNMLQRLMAMFGMGGF